MADGSIPPVSSALRVGSEISPPIEFGHGLTLQIYQVSEGCGALPSLVLRIQRNGRDDDQSKLIMKIYDATGGWGVHTHPLEDGGILLHFPHGYLGGFTRNLERSLSGARGEARLGLHDLKAAYLLYVTNQWRPQPAASRPPQVRGARQIKEVAVPAAA